MIAIARKIRPRRFITFIVVAWGLVTVGHGLVKTWRQMLALRALLGILEAGYFSTSAYLVSTWYIRSMLDESHCERLPDTDNGYRRGREAEFIVLPAR